MKTIQKMKNALRTNLPITDEDKRAETLMRLTLLWDLSGAFAGTSEGFACATDELRREFSIPEGDIHDAMKRSEVSYSVECGKRLATKWRQEFPHTQSAQNPRRRQRKKRRRAGR